MAFLTYRQSDYKNSNPTQQQKDIIVDRPLTMFEIDQNFYSINNEVINLTLNSGLASTKNTPNTPLNKLFLGNNANTITATGFYKTNATINTPLKENTKSVILHIQGDGDTLNDVGAMQIVAGIGNGDDDNHESKLYFRNQLGNGDWDSWSRVATSGEILRYVDEINQKLDLKVNINGDASGNATFNSKLVLRLPTDIIVSGYTRGDTPNNQVFNRINFVDDSNVAGEDHKLGNVDYTVSANFVGISMTSFNPVITSNNSEESSLKVGWTFKDNDYVTYTYAPSPIDGLGNNQIATTGYVRDACHEIILENWSEVLQGGTIESDFTIKGTLDSVVLQARNANVDNLISTRNAVKLPFIIGSNPIAKEEEFLGDLYFTSDGVVIPDDNNSTGKVENRIDTAGISEMSLIAIPNTTSLGELTNAKISVSVNKSGNLITTFAPTPPINDSSTQIATTEWVGQKVNDLFNAYTVNLNYLQSQIDVRPTLTEVNTLIQNNNNIATTEWVGQKVNDLFNAYTVNLNYLQSQIDVRPTLTEVNTLIQNNNNDIQSQIDVRPTLTEVNTLIQNNNNTAIANTLQNYPTKTDLNNNLARYLLQSQIDVRPTLTEVNTLIQNNNNTAIANTLQNYPTKTDLNNNLARYLPLAGGTMSGQIIYNVGSSWYNGRNVAVIRNTESTGYHPLISSKSGSYSWEIGTEGSDNGGGFRIGAVSDSNYNSGNNTQSCYMRVSTDGDIVASRDLIATSWCYAQVFRSTSDSRLKDNKEEMSYDLSSIKPYRYLLTTDNTTHVGLIAQEVEKVIPEAVSENEDGWKTLDYNSVVAALVGEVNSLKQQIKELKEMIKQNDN